MDATYRLVKNTLYLGLANLCSPLISMLLVIYISRTLGSEGLGAYSAALAFVFFFEKFAQLGIHQLLLRDIAAEPSRFKSYLTASTVIGLVSSLATMPIVYCVLQYMQYPQIISEGSLILSVSILFVVLSYYYQSILEGLQKMERRSTLSFLDAITRVGLGVLFVHLGYGVIGALAAVVVSRIVTCLCSLLFLLQHSMPLKAPIDFSLIRSLLRQTLTFLMISLVTTVFWRIDFVMLSQMKGPSDVGFYSAAYRLMEILTALTYSYIAALFPLMAGSAGVSLSSLTRQCELSIKYLFISTFPAAMGTFLLAPQVITLIYGKQFSESIEVLQILIWTICIFPLALVCARALVATRHQKYDLWANIFLIVSNIGANILLIPYYGARGAAVATLISVCVFFSIQGYYVSRILPHVHWSRLFLKPAIAGTAMALSVYPLRHLTLGGVVPIAALIYLALLLFLKTFSADEVQRFRNILGRLSPVSSPAS